MSRTTRLLVILAAWALPVVWVVAMLGTRPSDGSVVWTSPLEGGDRWGSTVVVTATYGETSLLPGDRIREIDGVPVEQLLAEGAAQDAAVGTEVSYDLERVEDGTLRRYVRVVTLSRFPVGRGVVEDLPIVIATLLLLAAGSAAFWLRPLAPASQAFLACASLVPIGLVSSVWGLGAVDLAGGRGYWPHVASEVLCVVGFGFAVLAAATLRAPRAWLARHMWAVGAAVLAPFAGYAVWATVSAVREDGPALEQALLSVAAPSLLVAVPTVFAVLLVTYLRARTREVRLAARLALLVLAAGVTVHLLLGDLPDRLVGGPVLPFDVLLLLLAPPVLTGLVVALVGYRLEDVEPAVRRTVIQGAVGALVGTTFVVVAGTIGPAADIPVGAILAGGVVALLVLPVAVALQRAVRRLFYGDRDLPRSVITELRTLDATTPPTEALTETLTLLSRRLRLSYAAIDVPAANGDEPVVASVGRTEGDPVTVELMAGGTRIGSLHLEAGPDRDRFGRGDRRLLEDVGAQVGALVQAVLVNRDLQRSRQDLVTAREEERRRLRRDLHDGLGPSLATMAMRLESAEDLIATDPEQARQAVAALAELARDEIAEVRRVVDGLRPAALDQLGLVSALRQRAAQHQLGAPEEGMVWTVDAEDVEPLPAAVEVAAYRIVMEAVTNAVRHSGARACTVALRREDGVLRVRVEDDGEGLAEQRAAGVGLFSMRERAEELGGTCVVTSTGHGTLVEARLPLGQEIG
jgi:signal transduction histidine kinase